MMMIDVQGAVVSDCVFSDAEHAVAHRPTQKFVLGCTTAQTNKQVLKQETHQYR